MAGRRLGKGPNGEPKPRRFDMRRDQHMGRINSAKTGRGQAAHAFDYARSVACHCPDADAKLNELATMLTNWALEVEHDHYPARG